ncbi:MAG: aldehyde ferredoxin oxidoreductase family protein [Chloroflexi bacterium]|nr:aldehyde ferredoxin oxidoreductase family protein [Chloroflexota bacterium]
MPNGYWGKILCVNLSSGKIEVEEPPEEIYRRYFGGYGLGVHYLYQRIPSGADPLGAQNILAFLPGLLTGSGAQFSGRFMVAARSPLTGGWADANCGGDFGPALRGAGWDGLFISGAAERPVYLFIDGNNVEVRDAAHLWGLNVRDTEQTLHKEIASDAKVACIGSAGEKLSLISGIVNDDGRLAARCGLGAVMGSKKLKAVVACGKPALSKANASRPALADAKTFKEATANYLKLFRQKPSGIAGYIPALMSRLLPLMRRFHAKPSGGSAELVIDTFRRYGTSSGTAIQVELGDTPVRNWTGIGYRDFPLELSEGLSDRAVIASMLKPYACHACPVACGGLVKQPDGGTSHKSEYETLASFGPLLMVSDLPIIMQCNHVCNMSGLDSISTGVVIAFALECAEKGWLPPELKHELKLEWGNDEAILELTERIAARTPGLGDWLADGVAAAAQRLPTEARQASMHAGGQELAMHRGIYEPGVAVGYALDPAPGRHTSTNAGNAEVAPFAPYFTLHGRQPAKRYDYAEEGVTQAISMCLYRAYDSLGLCQFALLMGEPPFPEWLNAATGWNMDEAEFYRIGKRIQVMRHAFNAKHGLPAQFPLPKRELGDPPQAIGPVRNRTLDMEAMAKNYFEFLGIDPRTGLPLSKTIEELRLDVAR